MVKHKAKPIFWVRVGSRYYTFSAASACFLLSLYMDIYFPLVNYICCHLCHENIFFYKITFFRWILLLNNIIFCINYILHSGLGLNYWISLCTLLNFILWFKLRLLLLRDDFNHFIVTILK